MLPAAMEAGAAAGPRVKRLQVDPEDGSGPRYPYLLGTTLGEGSYGLVREGLDVETAKVVAIKSLDRRLLKKQRRGLENLEREIRLHKRLGRHSTIVDLVRPPSPSCPNPTHPPPLPDAAGAPGARWT